MLNWEKSEMRKILVVIFCDYGSDTSPMIVDTLHPVLILLFSLLP